MLSETTNSYESPDGFTISEELELTPFLARKNEDYGMEHIHVIPDPERREIRVYRSVTEDAGGPKIMTRLSGSAAFRKSHEFETPDGWYLTGGKGETLLTLLRCFRGETTADELRLVWYPRNNSPAMTDAGYNGETLIISYRTASGREEMVQLDDTYTTRSHMMAIGDGYKF